MILLSILALFISVYFNVNDELEAAACHFPSLNDVADVCSTCVLYPCACAVCVCMQSVAARVKRSKVWAHVTKLSDTSIRCNICSSVILNRGGNTSNIMKHLLTKHNIYLKQCIAYLLCLPAPAAARETHSHQMLTHSAVELHSRDTALIRNHKSTLFACALV